MLAWLGYTMLVTLMLGVAALAAERAARLRGLPARWIWSSAMVSSLLLPLIVSSVSIELPAVFTPAGAGKTIVLREATAVRLPAPDWIARTAAPLAARASAAKSLDPMIRRGWMAVSATMLLALAASAAHLYLRKRRWPVQRIAGADVYIAPDAGPAVVGLLRPRIVLPRWLLQAPPAQQALVMAHEKAHLEARDPQLLSVALCLLVAMPWNLPLWWQLRRLRHAIEVDCDARVLRAGHDLRQYGEALLDVGQRQSGYLGAAAAMAESRSLLEQRMRIMLRVPGRWSRAAAVTMASAALCVAAAAAQIAPPNAARPNAERQQMAMSTAALTEYEGMYLLEEFQAITLTREGHRLWSQVPGRNRIELYPERPDQFFSRDIEAQFRFRRDAGGRLVSVSVDRFGVTRQAQRLNLEQSAAHIAKMAAHSARDGAMPGGEAALRRNADAATTGKLHLDDLAPSFRAEAQARLAASLAQPAKFQPGKLRSLEFQGIDRSSGEDIYRAEYDKVTIDWLLLVDSQGKISQAWALRVPPR